MKTRTIYALAITIILYLPLAYSSELEKPFPDGPPYKQQVFFNSGMLFVPHVQINNTTYIDATLNLNNDGTYHLAGISQLKKEEDILAKKIASMPCGIAHTLERFSALRAITNQGVYCIVKTTSITIEGARELKYLFINDGIAEVITDYRNDPFRGEVNLASTLYENIEFGYIINDNFVTESELANIKFDYNYILKLSKNNIEEIY